MSDDVVFLLAGGGGAIFGLWRVVDGGLARATALRTIIIASTALIGAILFDGLRALSNGRGFFDHYSDLGILVLLSLVMILPFWGLFDERILARVSEFGIALLGVTAAARTLDRVGWAPAAVVAAASGLTIGLLLRRRDHDGVRLLGYGWFLLCTVLLAVLEGDHALALINDDIVEVAPAPTFAAFAALMWLAFHIVFASKFVLIALSSLTTRGRQFAYAFGARMVVPSTASPVAGAVAIGIAALVLVSDVLFDWAPDAMLVAAVIFTIPIVETMTDRTLGARQTQPA